MVVPEDDSMRISAVGQDCRDEGISCLEIVGILLSLLELSLDMRPNTATGNHFRVQSRLIKLPCSG